MNAAPRHRSIGIDVGGTKILGVILGDDGSILAEHRIATPTSRDGAPGTVVADGVKDVVAHLTSQIEDGGEVALPVGIGVPGLVERSGQLLFAPNLQGANGANFTTLLQERLAATTVTVENDANCAGLAEHHFGAGRAVDDALLVTLGTGIGGAVLIGGSLVRGAKGFAGEFGHMMVDPNGPRCPCGSTGCWERYASGAGVRHFIQEAVNEGKFDPNDHITPESLFDRARGGDPVALGIIETYCWWLAKGLASLCAIFDPELIMIGGGVASDGDLIMESTTRHLTQEIEGAPHRTPPRLALTVLGERAGAIGAALVAERGPGR